jgi:hypothetical protein
MKSIQKQLVVLGLFGVLILLPSCGNLSILGQEFFNTNFLVDTGTLTGGAEGQITPDLKAFLTLKVQNQTIYPANITIAVKRAQTTEEFEITLAAGQTVGKLLEDCNSTTNPILSLYVPILENSGVGEVFVTVEGLPVLVSSTQLPGVLNVRTDFNCGDTVQFVITPSFVDTDRFQVGAVIFYGNTN